MKIANLEIKFSLLAVGIVRTLKDGLTETIFMQVRGFKVFKSRWFEKGGVEWLA